MAGTDWELVEWLRTQLDAHEAEARALLGDAQQFRQQLRETRLLGTEQVGHYRWADVERMAFGVLVGIAATRHILAEHQPVTRDDATDGPYTICVMCRTPDHPHEGAWLHPCPTVRTLAAAYAGRPGYRKEWGST
jgi:hypothetical protein